MLREAEHDEEPPRGEAQVCWGRGARARQKGRDDPHAGRGIARVWDQGRGAKRVLGEGTHDGQREILGSEKGSNGCSERLITMARGRLRRPGRGAKWVPREANHPGTQPILGSGCKMGAPRG